MHPILKKQLENLEKFVRGEISKEEYLDLQERTLKSLNPRIVDIFQIPLEIRQHELEHARVIRKYGLKPIFVEFDGIYAVTFSSEKMRGWEKEKIIKFLLDLCSTSSYSEFDHLVYYILIYGTK